jgi:hypothetical protein
MAANKNFQDATKPQQTALRMMWICPSCGKTVSELRRYCDCHADLLRAKTMLSVDRPQVKSCNFETKGLCCADCPGECEYCFGFGLLKPNRLGFGGPNCRQGCGTTRRYCCQRQAKMAANLAGGELARIIVAIQEANGKAESGEAETENLFLQAASVIHDGITAPILARIQRAEDAR